MITLTADQFKKKYGDVGHSVVTTPKSTVGGDISSAFSSGVDQVKEGYNQSKKAKNPLELIEGGAKQAAGVINTALSPLAPVTKYVGKGVDYVADKISNNKAVQDFSITAAGKTTARIAEDVGNLDTIAGAVAGVKTAPKIVSVIDKAGTKILDDAGKSLTKPREVIRSTVDKAPEKIMQRVARISKGAQAKFEQTAGESVGKYLTKRGIYGNVDEISSQLYKRFQNSKGEADTALAKLKGAYNPAPIKTALQELVQREERVSSEGAPSPDLAKVTEFASKIDTKGLSMSEINEVKRIYERSIKLDFLKQNLPEGVARANNIDNAIRDWQFKKAESLGLKNLPEINKETRLSKQLLDNLGKEYSGRAGNNAISLTDWIMLSGGDPTSIAGFLTKKTFSSKSVQSAIAKALNKRKPVMGEVKANFSTRP